MDRRQQKTRAAIFEAFGRLLSQGNYSGITVQDIIDEANIGRSTFYAHFETKDSLLKAMCADLFEHIFTDAMSRVWGDCAFQGEQSHLHEGAPRESDPHTMVTHILHHLRDNQKNLVGMLRGESGDLFLRYFQEYLLRFIDGYLLTGVETGGGEIPRDFLLNHISSSFVGMVQWWVRGGLKESPEALSAWFMALTLPGAQTVQLVQPGV